MLMRFPIPGTANKFLVISRLRLRAAVGLLTDHTTLRAQLYKLGHTLRQECWLYVHEKEESVHIISLSCLSLQQIQDLGQYVPKVRRSWESEGGQPIKPSGQHRAWLNLLTSRTSKEIQRIITDLGMVRVRYGTPRHFTTTITTTNIAAIPTTATVTTTNSSSITTTVAINMYYYYYYA